MGRPALVELKLVDGFRTYIKAYQVADLTNSSRHIREFIRTDTYIRHILDFISAKKTQKIPKNPSKHIGYIRTTISGQTSSDISRQCEHISVNTPIWTNISRQAHQAYQNMSHMSDTSNIPAMSNISGQTYKADKANTPPPPRHRACESETTQRTQSHQARKQTKRQRSTKTKDRVAQKQKAE